MKKSILASLIAVTSLGLVGCDDSGSESPDNRVSSRQVTMTVLSENIGDMSVTDTEQGYRHNIVTNGYTIHVDELDDGGDSYDIDNVSLPSDVVLDIWGEAEVTVYHKQEHHKGTAYRAYSVRGSKSIGAKEEIFSMTVENEDYAYVTVIQNEDIDPYNPPMIDGVRMNGADESGEIPSDIDGIPSTPDNVVYWYGYITKDSRLTIEHSSAGSLFRDISMNVNKHYEYEVQTNQDGKIGLGEPNFGDVPPIEPVQPVLSSGDTLGLDVTSWDPETGAVMVRNKIVGAKVAINTDGKRTLETYSDYETDRFNDKTYIAPFDMDANYGMYVNIYLGSCKATDSLAFIYNIDSQDVTQHHDVENGFSGSWHQFVEEHGQKAVPVCLEAPSGNFFLRSNVEITDEFGNGTGEGHNDDLSFVIYNYAK